MTGMWRRAGDAVSWRSSVGLVAASVAGAVLVGCGSTVVTSPSVSPSPPAAATTDPPIFAISQGTAVYPPPTAPIDRPGTRASGPTLQIRSVSTGRLERTLTAEDGTVSLSPDGKTVYYESTSAPLDPFPIDRISTGGGHPVRVASGEDPAVSPNSADLAYATGNGRGVAVENLARHTTRRVDLKALIGPGASFNNTPGVVAWLSRTMLLAVPPPDGTRVAFSMGRLSAGGAPGTCTAMYRHDQQCAIVIALDAARPARVVTLDLPRRYRNITAAGAGRPRGACSSDRSGLSFASR